MAADKEAFLDRWSRLKREERAAADEAQVPAAPPAAGAAESEAPPLPPMESLTPESDFSVFMHPKVPELMRRTALKKLFQDPRYNVVDKFEAYWQDFTQDEGISPELLKTLDQARRHVFGEQREERAPEIGQESAPASSPGDPAAAAPAPAEAPSASAPQQQNDVPRTQDS